MKKRVLAIATALICALGFTACEEGSDTQLLEQIIEQNDLVGHITLTINDVSGVQPYVNGDTIRFKSAVANVKIDTIYMEDGTTINSLEAGILMMGTRDNVVTAEQIEAPYLGINLRDTVTGPHTISCPIDNIQFFQYLSETDLEELILSGIAFQGVGNLFAIAQNDDHYYIGYSGTIDVSERGSKDGDAIKCDVNVNTLYVSETQLDDLANNRISVNDVPKARFTGEVSSRRANMTVIINALESQEDNQ